MTQSRSTSSFSEQRSLESSGGSIGATRPGTYVENARPAAPRSSGEPGATKCETSAMCTHARMPSASRTTEIASSKSFAVSGSIVKVVSSRRSVRPSDVTGGGSNGSNSCRAPRSTSNPSSTLSTRSAGPSTRSTFARPRPLETTASSPRSAPLSDLRSRTIGVPGEKYGSPTTSFPRPAISTTVRTGSRLDLEEAAQRQRGPGDAEQQSDPDQDQRIQRERHRMRVFRVPDVDQRQDHGLAEDQQDHGG